jgi:hypothetical protein
MSSDIHAFLTWADTKLAKYDKKVEKNTLPIELAKAPIKKQNYSRTAPRSTTPSIYKPVRKYTAEEKQQGLSLLRKGFTIRQVSDAMDIPTGIVRYWYTGDVNPSTKDLYERNRRQKRHDKLDKLDL